MKKKINANQGEAKNQAGYAADKKICQVKRKNRKVSGRNQKET